MDQSLNLGKKTIKQIKSHDATNLLFFMFRVFGINSPKRNKMAYFIYAMVLNILLIVFLPISFTISMSTRPETEIDLFLAALQTGVNLYACAGKFVTLVLTKSKLRQSESIMDKLDARCSTEDEKNEIKKAVKSGNRIVVLFLVAYNIYSLCTFLSSIAFGAPPYSLYIPFINWRNSAKEFYIASALEYVAVNMLCTQQVVNDSYSVVYLCILRTQLKILGMRVQKLGLDRTKTKEESTKELINCIEDHTNILKLYYIFHSVISITIFIQFAMTSAVVSIALVNMLLFGNISTVIKSVAFIGAVSLESLPCCYFAHCLMDESDQLPNIIFHSDWIEQDEKYKKMLVFFMQRSQRRLTMTAGLVLPITLNSFLAIAKSSFSLYMLLNELGCKNE